MLCIAARCLLMRAGTRQRWEARRDAGSGMSFFIDHKEKKTYWEEELPAEGRAALQAAAAAKQQRQQPTNGTLMHASASAPDLAQTARCTASPPTGGRFALGL